MTIGADHVLSQGNGTAAVRWRAALASTGAGVTGAVANMLLVAFVVLHFARPGEVQATLGLIACLLAAISAALLAPVALLLGGTRAATLGVATSACLTVVWLLMAAEIFSPYVGLHLVAGGALGLAAWLVLVCRRDTVPRRAARVGRRAGVAALVGTVLVVVGDAVFPAASSTWMAMLAIGGLPAVFGWLAVPAWSLRMGRWLRLTDGSVPARP
jgi:hypothetical protein